MMYLLLTVLLNTFLFALFKLFPRWGINGWQAIVSNYVVCVLTGSVLIKKVPFSVASTQQGWFPWSLLMGAMFISLFNLIAWRTREDGMTTTTVANKLSLVIPVAFSFVLYGESISLLKVLGIAVAFPAVYLSTRAEGIVKKPRSWAYPLLLFVGSGLLDTLVKYVEHHYLNNAEQQALYTIHVFATAALLGVLSMGYNMLFRGMRLSTRSLWAGVILGIPNYFSIFFLIKLLHSGFLQSSAAIPVNNIGIVLFSALVAMLLFREKPTAARLVGLLLSVLAILLIALADIYG